MAIGIGMDIGGLGYDAAARNLIGELTEEVGRRFLDIRSHGEVFLLYVYILGGDLDRPDFTGVKSASWAPSDQSYVIRVGIPEPLGGPLAVREFLAASLKQGLEKVDAVSARRKLQGPSEDDRAGLRALQEWIIAEASG